MATQRMTVATLVGAAAAVVIKLFAGWRSNADPAAVDQLCVSLRDHYLSLPVVYFSEWVDRWSMGDALPGDGVEGRRYKAVCLSPEQARVCAARCGEQFFEQGWLAARLREAAIDCASVAEEGVVLLLREVVGPTTIDQEVRRSLSVIPAWLDTLQRHTHQDAPADRPRDQGSSDISAPPA
jgi:hypothetical protein